MAVFRQMTLNQTTYFDGNEWLAYFQGKPSFQYYHAVSKRFNDKINRGDLLRLAQDAILKSRCNSGSNSNQNALFDFIAAVIVWGMGSTRANGPIDVELSNSYVQQSIIRAVTVLSDPSKPSRVLDSYLTLLKIDELGPSFLTKILYFIALSRKYHFNDVIDPFPIIADQFLNKAVTRLVKKSDIKTYLLTRKRRNSNSRYIVFWETKTKNNQLANQNMAHRYIKICELIQTISRNISIEPDDFEYILFKEAKLLGPAYEDL